MAITYTWTVTKMTVLQTPNPDTVTDVDWTCTGVDGEHTAEMRGVSRLPALEEGSTFVSYADLDQAAVLAWVWEELGEGGKSNTQACIEGQINHMITPPVSPTNEPLPW